MHFKRFHAHWLGTFVLLSIFAKQAASLNEIRTFNDKISAATPDADCVANANNRPCLDAVGNPLAGYPSNYPCPCPARAFPSVGGAIVGNGKPSIANTHQGEFVNEILVQGFTNPVAMCFTDNTNVLFVGTKEGIVHWVNLKTGEKHVWIDLQDEVGNAGDRGLLGIATSPDFAGNPYVFLLYTADPVFGAPDEGMETPAVQRLTRYVDKAGYADPASRFVLFGATNSTGVPICYNTHAVGSVKFGWDGSLFVTTGDGGHWNFDLGDFGQNQEPEDYLCELKFGDYQDVGAFRSQQLESLGGKLLRLDPMTGKGICQGSAYATLNPYCEAGGESPQSKIWALGLRNPFRMNVRPPGPGDNLQFPGVPYFGDVGEGGYEEVNAVRFSGMNFGWPCWEGPLPMPRFAFSPLNNDPTVRHPTRNGQNVTCPWMYDNLETTLPFFFWSRFHKSDPAGYFGQNAYLGQGFYGNTVAGIAFYTGDKYPSQYKNSVFLLEYSQWWIRVAVKDNNDQFLGIQDFFEADTAILTLEIDPATGNVCYLTLNRGEVRCFRYQVSNVPPTVSINANPLAGPIPLTVMFSADGSFDRENDQILLRWDFGDGSFSNLPNPSHTFTQSALFTVTLNMIDRYGNSASSKVTINTMASQPVVEITKPSTGELYIFGQNEEITISANVTNGETSTYRWEFQIVHNNHIHTDQMVATAQTLKLNISDNSHAGERANYRVELTVTNPQGLSAKDAILLSPWNWNVTMQNTPPHTSFLVQGWQPPTAGQVVQFNAQQTFDSELDHIFYRWNFGDGTPTQDGTNVMNHLYNAAGTYNVTLMTMDNWGGASSFSSVVTVSNPKSMMPQLQPPAGEIYDSFSITMKCVEPIAAIRYTIDGSTPTAQSPLYTQPIPVNFQANKNVTIKAISTVAGKDNSLVVTYTYQMIAEPCSDLIIKHNCSLACSLRSDIAYAETIPPAGGINSVSQPPFNQSKVLRYLITSLNGTYDAARDSTQLHLFVNGGTTPGQAVQARVSYDFTNDGTWDRVETFELFACDPIPESWEEYTFATYNQKFPLPNSIVGSPTYLDLINGAVQLEIWQAIGSGNPPMQIITDGILDNKLSTIELPYTVRHTAGPDCLKCPAGMALDSCGVCGGPGPTGCDLQCFSTKVDDVCGDCGGPGLTGCDNQCHSSKVVDSCGVCGGGNSSCVIPPNSYPCYDLAIRGNCPDLVCGSLNFEQPTDLLIPASGGPVTPNHLPLDPSKIITLYMNGLTGFYDVDKEFTEIRLYIDALNIPSVCVQVAVSYDWTSDGYYDRVELYDIYAVNDLTGYDLWNKRGYFGDGGGLVADPVVPFEDMVNGAVRVELWQCLESYSPAFIKTDLGDSFAATTMVRIPYITAYAFNKDGTGDCGFIQLPSTTGVYTTGSACDSCSTGGSGTTGGSTTGTTGCSELDCPVKTCQQWTECMPNGGEVVCHYNTSVNGTPCQVFDPPTACFEGTCLNGVCTTADVNAGCLVVSGSWKTAPIVSMLLLLIALVMA